MGKRKVLLASILALALAAAPQAALAASYADSVAGVEIYATSTLGIFAGSASGDLPGAWYVTVLHTPLSGSPETATIVGGSFKLRTSDGATTVLGAFTGGSVTQTGGFSECANQTYSVMGNLAISAPAPGTGTFSAVLTHYRTVIFGRCVTYAASVVGQVALAY
jgi:hypothetical protein